MTNFLIRTGVNAVALWVAAWLIDGIHLADGDATFASKFATIVLVALIFGVVNAVVKPIAKVLTFPFIVLTLGLFTFVETAEEAWALIQRHYAEADAAPVPPA